MGWYGYMVLYTEEHLYTYIQTCHSTLYIYIMSLLLIGTCLCNCFQKGTHIAQECCDILK